MLLLLLSLSLGQVEQQCSSRLPASQPALCLAAEQTAKVAATTLGGRQCALIDRRASCGCAPIASADIARARQRAISAACKQ